MTVSLLLAAALTQRGNVNPILKIETPLWLFLDVGGASAWAQTNRALNELAMLAPKDQIRHQLEFVRQCQKLNARPKNNSLALEAHEVHKGLHPNYDLGKLDIIAIACGRGAYFGRPDSLRFIARKTSEPFAIKCFEGQKHDSDGTGLSPSRPGPITAVDFVKVVKIIKSGHFVLQHHKHSL
jgi:hypothetical protein